MIKPSAAQLGAAQKKAVCESFKGITFSQKNDSELTVKQIREFNAALRSYGCIK